MPIPPTPMTITASPGATAAEFTDEPHPVPTPQPSRHRVSRGRSLGTFTADMTETTVYSQKVEMPDIWPTRSPSVVRSRKLVGSPGRAPLRMVAPTLQRFWWPVAHQRQRPQAARNEKTTWSPTSKPGVLGPTCSTTPDPSWPPAMGSMPVRRSPVAKWSSEWHRPAATIRTNNSSWRGSSKSNSMHSYWPGEDLMTAPRVRMNCPLVWSAGVAVTPRQNSYQPGKKQASPGGAGFIPGASAGLAAHRGHVDQEVVGHQRDGQVHEHEDDHGSDRLALGQYPQVGKEQHQRHQDGQAKEQPAGSR